MPLIFRIKVVPSTGRSLCKIDKDGQLKCFLKSPPEKGKANKELIKLLAKALKLPQDQVVIIAGAKERKKRIEIDKDITFDELLDALGLARQQNLFE
jgi:uncharacterized protein